MNQKYSTETTRSQFPQYLKTFQLHRAFYLRPLFNFRSQKSRNYEPSWVNCVDWARRSVFGECSRIFSTAFTEKHRLVGRRICPWVVVKSYMINWTISSNEISAPQNRIIFDFLWNWVSCEIISPQIKHFLRIFARIELTNFIHFFIRQAFLLVFLV